MKIKAISLLILSSFFLLKNVQSKQLPLLVPNEKFKTEILNCVLNNFGFDSDVLMLRIVRKDVHQKNEAEDYELRITRLSLECFTYFNLTKDKYFGYLEFKGHTVLVYGDQSPMFFFSKTKLKKQFDILSLPPYDDSKHPPVSIEPEVYVYIFTKNQFTPIESGMLGFYN